MNIFELEEKRAIEKRVDDGSASWNDFFRLAELLRRQDAFDKAFVRRMERGQS